MSLKLRILIVVTNADLAGAPIHVRDLAIQLAKLGFTVNVVFGESGTIQKEVQENNITTHVISTLRSDFNVINDIKTIRSLNRIVDRFKPDLIHAHSSKAGLISRLVGCYQNLPVVYTIHGWGFGVGRRIMVSIFVYFNELLLSRFTSFYIAVSRKDADIGKRALLINENKICTVYNSTNFSHSYFESRLNDVNIIMVARNDKQKDYTTFFKSLSILDVNNVNSVIVVGRGTDSEKFIQEAEKLSGNAFKKIKFLGVRSDVEYLLESSSIFVLSSKFEGLPISVIEAMSKGLPIIASDVGGVPELVKDGKNGFLFASGDSQSLCSKLQTMISNFEMRKCFGSSSYSYYRSTFTVEGMVNEIIDVYHKSIK